MENPAGYTRVLARSMVAQGQQKRLLGKPYLLFSQGHALWEYFFQLASILGAKYAGKLDAFGPAFLGVQGATGAVERFFNEVATRMVSDFWIDSATYSDFVTADLMKRMGSTGDTILLIQNFGTRKIRANMAAEYAWQFAERGAAFGAVYPDEIHRLFERSQTEISRRNLEKACSSGLGVPRRWRHVDFEEVEHGEDELFLAYCRESCPGLYRVLASQNPARM